MDVDLFTIVSDRLCERSDLDRLESRGTVRIAFKRAGVDVKRFGLVDLEAVFAKIMPEELELRGCVDPGPTCDAIVRSLEGEAPRTVSGSSDEIIRRLGSG
jgi:hypothetical protein